MFICEKCLKECNVDFYRLSSYGKCEKCGVTILCADIHHSQLPIKQITFMDYIMTEEQKLELEEKLADDILERYNNEEYWEKNIIEQFVVDNKLKKDV